MVQTVLVDRAADLLGVSRRTVYYRIRDGKLQTIRTVGGSQRVLLASIESLLREGVRQAPGTGAWARARGAGVSGTGLSGRSPAP
jgi:excisionase family DNA binding protein